MLYCVDSIVIYLSDFFCVCVCGLIKYLWQDYYIAQWGWPLLLHLVPDIVKLQLYMSNLTINYLILLFKTGTSVLWDMSFQLHDGSNSGPICISPFAASSGSSATWLNHYAVTFSRLVLKFAWNFWVNMNQLFNFISWEYFTNPRSPSSLGILSPTK